MKCINLIIFKIGSYLILRLAGFLDNTLFHRNSSKPVATILYFSIHSMVKGLFIGYNEFHE